MTKKRQPHNSQSPTPEKLEIFLDKLAETANVVDSCNHAGLSRHHIYALKKRDDEFKQKFDEARELGIDALEDNSFTRARSSDTMAIFMLKCNRPGKYGDKQSIDHTGTVSVSLNMVMNGQKD